MTTAATTSNSTGQTSNGPSAAKQVKTDLRGLSAAEWKKLVNGYTVEDILPFRLCIMFLKSKVIIRVTNYFTIHILVYIHTLPVDWTYLLCLHCSGHVGGVCGWWRRSGTSSASPSRTDSGCKTHGNSAWSSHPGSHKEPGSGYCRGQKNKVTV